MEIVVPELGESVVEATVARWLKQEGETVALGEPVVALETDKVDLEVGARQDGVLKRILHPEGDDVKVGEVLGEIEPAAAGGDAGHPPEAKPEEPAKTARKAEQPEPSPSGQAEEPPPPEPDKAKQPQSASPEQPAAGRRGDGASAERITPVARRLAEEHGIDIRQVLASGPGERVTKEDIERYIDLQRQPAPASSKGDVSAKETTPAPATAATETPAGTTQPVAERPAQRASSLETRQRMSRRRRTIAARLVEAQRTAAMLTTFNDVDMSSVMDLRSRRQEEFLKKHGVKLGFMSFFVKASVGALKAFPRLNAEIQEDEIVLKHYYDIGIAIGAEEGLVVPVLRAADRMSFAEVEQTIQGYVDKSRQGNLSIEDLRGGTFSITNGGVFGSLLSTPILNPPQVAILGMHRIEPRPVAHNDQVVIRPMMYLALSYDHRIVDGSEAVRFLKQIKEYIEDPEALLFAG
jgi:2-oxoglutarate dehydrogenase E2 component (dihydrolipoamide succinyltransferase)